MTDLMNEPADRGTGNPRHGTGPVERGDSVAAAVSEVGDRWTFLVLREAFYGVQRFTDMHANLGIARNILSNRLSRLVDKGILERAVDTAGGASQGPRYRLTAKGRDLYPVALALMQWADQWVTDQNTTRPVHRECGGSVEVVVRCSECGTTLAANEASYDIGGGRADGL
jgi:DNA-binding HxlR family transcriptional regulator